MTSAMRLRTPFNGSLRVCPYFSKSNPNVEGSWLTAAARGILGGGAGASLIALLTSSSVMRPLDPVPVTVLISTPNSRAKCLVCGVASTLRGAAGFSSKTFSRLISTGGAAVSAGIAAGFSASDTASSITFSVSKIIMGSPTETVSPGL